MRLAINTPLRLLRHGKFPKRQVLHRVRKASRFCGGKSQRATAASSPIPAADAGATDASLEGERKTVTALFVDFKGSTELLETLDPEEGRVIVEPLLRIMSDAVRRYEGYLVRTTGDGVFALFGAPVAYEDHPQRALYAALQMQQELRAYTRSGNFRGTHDDVR